MCYASLHETKLAKLRQFTVSPSLALFLSVILGRAVKTKRVGKPQNRHAENNTAFLSTLTSLLSIVRGRSVGNAACGHPMIEHSVVFKTTTNDDLFNFLIEFLYIDPI